MKLLFYTERLQILHRLILARKTGTPSELAFRLNISLSRLARIIEELRDMGAPIRYDRQSRTYFYESPYEISIIVSFGKN